MIYNFIILIIYAFHNKNPFKSYLFNAYYIHTSYSPKAIIHETCIT